MNPPVIGRAHQTHAAAGVEKRGDAGRLLALLIVGSLLLPPAAVASRPTMDECFEASDFIRNAALARDVGMHPEAFLGRMEDDLVAIRAFPNDLRWFAHDEEDETFLLAEAHRVFERPTSAEAHRADFLRACIERMGTP